MSMGNADIKKLSSSAWAVGIWRTDTNRSGRRVFAAAAAFAFVAGCALTGAARADSDMGSDGSGQMSSGSTKSPQIDLAITNANLLSVVDSLRMQSRAQFVVISGDYHPVTLNVTTSLQDALNYIAASAGATLTRDDNGVYIFRPAGSLVSDAESQPAAAAPAPPVDSDAIPDSSLHYERIPLQNQSPNYILTMLNDSDGIRDTDPSDDPINNAGMSRHSPVAVITPGSPSIQMQGSAQQLGQPEQPSVPANNNSYSGAVSQANDSVPGRGNDEANQFPQGFPQAGGGAFNPFQNNGLAQTNPGANGGPNGQNGNAANLRPRGISSIIANEEDNSLIVRGTAEGIAELKQIINFLDRAPKQVEIKVEFVTANVADADSFGINWDMIPFPNTNVGFDGPAIGSTLGTTFLSYAQGNLVAQLQGLLSTSKGKVIAAPIVTTTNNTPATIDFSQEIPYQTTTTVAQSGGNAITGTQTNFLQITNNLTVTPRINGDDSVSLLLTPTLQTPGTPPFTGGPPPLSQQRVQTYRTVANGETMVIGGLVNKQTTNDSVAVPFLSELPIIGSLFRTRNLNVSDTELLIFVTPTVLPPIGANMGASANSNSTDTSDAGVGVGVTP